MQRIFIFKTQSSDNTFIYSVTYSERRPDNWHYWTCMICGRNSTQMGLMWKLTRFIKRIKASFYNQIKRQWKMFIFFLRRFFSFSYYFITFFNKWFVLDLSRHTRLKTFKCLIYLKKRKENGYTKVPFIYLFLSKETVLLSNLFKINC